MIAAWMLHAVVVALLACAAGAALDRLLRPHRRPVRWVWLGVLGLGAGLPLFRLLVDRGPGGSAGALPGSVPLVTLDALRPTVGADDAIRSLDPYLPGAWALLVVALLVLFGRSALRTRRLRGKWKARRIGEGEVLVSPDVGPAVVGLLRPDVVVPEWMLGTDPEALELAVLHEREHVRSRDPVLVGLGALLLLVTPWNPFLWWAFRRLREAVEVDCDARVLSARPGRVGSYANTLLEGGRRRVGPAGLGPALTQPRSFLERRIRTMTSTRPSRPVIRSVALGAVALLALTGACLAPDAREGEAGPVDVDGDPNEEAVTRIDAGANSPASGVEAPASGPRFTPFTVKPDIKNRYEVQRALERAYPPLLREAGIGGTTQIWFYIDTEGAVRDVRIRESSGHEALDRAALRVARTFEFTSALNGDERVPVWIALPMTFTTD